jgi:hypothetical protein
MDIKREEAKASDRQNTGQLENILKKPRSG